MRKQISQREAHRLQKRVEKLEAAVKDHRRAWAREWFGGVHLGSVVVGDRVAGSIDAARRLEHAVVAVIEGNEVRFYGCKIGDGGA